MPDEQGNRVFMPVSVLTIYTSFWPRSLETWVQLPRCHSAAIHFHDLVVSAGNPRTRTALSGSHLRHYGKPQPPSGGKIATFILALTRSKRPVVPHCGSAYITEVVHPVGRVP